MFYNYYILLIISLLATISCRNSALEESQEIQQNNLTIPKIQPVNLEDSLFINIVQKYHQNAKFNKTVVNKNDLTTPILSQMFSTNGLLKIITYKKKEYKKLDYHSISNYFWLVILEYESSFVANHIFNEVRKTYLNSEKDRFFDDLRKITPHLSIKAQEGYADPSRHLKSGGFYTVKNSKIYYLVENCGNSKEYWKSYNELFLDYLFDKEKDYEVLNFNCGGEFPKF